MKSIEGLLRDKVFMMKLVWLGYIAGIALMVIGLYVIIMNLLG